MCRRNQLIGSIAAAFGVGLLIGMWIEGGFLCHCLGFALFLFGIASWCKR